MLLCNNNNLDNLDISYCTKLQQIYCGDNNLTELNLSGFQELNSLYCFNNSLPFLNLIDLDYLVNFNGVGQNVPLTLSKNNENNYTCEIVLNNPTFGNSSISYWEDILTSTNSNVSSTTFAVQTGNPSFELSGTMNFTYSDVSIFGKELSNSLIAYVENDKLLVSGLKIGEEWSVYTISGILVYKGVATKEEESFILKDTSGVYVVRSVHETVKVISD